MLFASCQEDGLPYCNYSNEITGLKLFDKIVWATRLSLETALSYCYYSPFYVLHCQLPTRKVESNFQMIFFYVSSKYQGHSFPRLVQIGYQILFSMVVRNFPFARFFCCFYTIFLGGAAFRMANRSSLPSTQS